MDAEKEKEIIYELMRTVIDERRELSKHYMDLKIRLDSLETKRNTDSKKKINESIGINQTSKQNASKVPLYKKTKKEPIERIAGYVSEILRKSPVPLRSKEIYEQLTHKNDIQIQYLNFRNNILPQLVELKQFSIEKAYRGYWQYRKGSD